MIIRKFNYVKYKEVIKQYHLFILKLSAKKKTKNKIRKTSFEILILILIIVIF